VIVTLKSPFFLSNMQTISTQVEEGWWSGTLNGKSGLFPSNFVKELELADDGETQDALDDAGAVLFCPKPLAKPF